MTTITSRFTVDRSDTAQDLGWSTRNGHALLCKGARMMKRGMAASWHSFSDDRCGPHVSDEDRGRGHVRKYSATIRDAQAFVAVLANGKGFDHHKVDMLLQDAFPDPHFMDE